MTAKHVNTAGNDLVSAVNGKNERAAANALRKFVYALTQTLSEYETRLRELEAGKTPSHVV